MHYYSPRFIPMKCAAREKYGESLLNLECLAVASVSSRSQTNAREFPFGIERTEQRCQEIGRAHV